MSSEEEKKDDEGMLLAPTSRYNHFNHKAKAKRGNYDDEVYEEGLEAMWIEETMGGSTNHTNAATILPHSPVAPSAVQKTRIRTMPMGKSRKFVTTVRLLEYPKVATDPQQQEQQQQQQQQQQPQHLEVVVPLDHHDADDDDNDDDDDNSKKPVKCLTLLNTNTTPQTSASSGGGGGGEEEEEEGQEQELSSLGFDNTHGEASPSAMSMSSLNEILDGVSPTAVATTANSNNSKSRGAHVPNPHPFPTKATAATTATVTTTTRKKKKMPLLGGLLKMERSHSSPSSSLSHERSASSNSNAKADNKDGNKDIGKHNSLDLGAVVGSVAAASSPDLAKNSESASSSPKPGDEAASSPSYGMNNNSTTSPTRDNINDKDSQRYTATVIEQYGDKDDSDVEVPDVDDSKTLEIDDKTIKLLQEAMEIGDVESVTSLDGIKKFCSIRRPSPEKAAEAAASRLARLSSPPRQPMTTQFVAAPKNVQPALLMQKSWEKLLQSHSVDKRDAPRSVQKQVQQKNKKMTKASPKQTGKKPPEADGDDDDDDSYDSDSSSSDNDSGDDDDEDSVSLNSGGCGDGDSDYRSDKYSVHPSHSENSDDRYSTSRDLQVTHEDKYTVTANEEEGDEEDKATADDTKVSPPPFSEILGDTIISTRNNNNNANQIPKPPKHCNINPSKRGLFRSFRRASSRAPKAMNEDQAQRKQEAHNKTGPLLRNSSGIKLKALSLFGGAKRNNNKKNETPSAPDDDDMDIGKSLLTIKQELVPSSETGGTKKHPMVVVKIDTLEQQSSSPKEEQHVAVDPAGTQSTEFSGDDDGDDGNKDKDTSGNANSDVDDYYDEDPLVQQIRLQTQKSREEERGKDPDLATNLRRAIDP